MNTNLECPVDGVQINETKVRLVAGLVLITGLVYLASGWLVWPLLLVVDFGLRSFDLGKYSLFANLAEGLVKTLRLPYKATDQAPKRFAARVGLAFGLLILGLQLAAISTLIPTMVLVIFATLESVFGFCAGCYVYTFYIRLFPKAA
ncbi:DUF4395 domain-containing protein [Spirosoma foliorum]|uniref:DUF4395 domain-containing protein n=1 Tax=Spirosoma foliorum TaxID=2710596 RepID=A0A7G5GP15_9BACT|nr:DUF4395 domain-containing protein [Spirosoma foliorum]QMW00607.1 DUF4395 domain-containing protein [Spirosoma foliorum]